MTLIIIPEFCFLNSLIINLETSKTPKTLVANIFSISCFATKYNHAAVLKIKFDNMNNPGSTTNKFNNNTYLQSETLNIEEGSSLTINLQSLFDDAKKLFKAAKANNYLSWGIINSGLVMAGLNTGIIENIQWFCSLVLVIPSCLALTKGLELVSQGIFTSDNNPKIIIKAIIEGETSKIEVYYQNGSENILIKETNSSGYNPEILTYVNLAGISLDSSMYFVQNK